jgi:hypothetical protein
VLRGLLAGVATALVLSAPAQAELTPRGTPLRITVVPIAQPGERVPSRAQLQRTMRRSRAVLARATYRRLRLEWAIAPPVARPRNPPGGLAAFALDHAAGRGIDVAGTIPVLIEATDDEQPSFGNPGNVQLRGRSWRYPDTVVHELGHAMGLDHAQAPTLCPRPFSPLRCANRPRYVYEYGDTYDVMGVGAGRYGAFALSVLNLASVRNAAPGRTTVRPTDGPRPTLLRLRTATHDYFVESRRRSQLRRERSLRAPRGVTIARVLTRGSPDRGLFPRTLRIPATDPARPCRAGTRACAARQMFAPGRTFTVPGAFRLRVVRGGVVTRWLDRTPPSLAVRSALVVRPPGAPAELRLDVAATATGAGVLRVEVDQGGVVTRVPADAVTGLSGRRGQGEVRVPLGAAPVASVRLVDAAGNASAPVGIDLATTPARGGAVVTWDPPLGAGRFAATPLRAGQAVTVTGRTDPALAGVPVEFEAIGTDETFDGLVVGPDGSFSLTWRAPRPGLYILRATIPVARAASGFDLVRETFEGHLRG